MWKIEAVGSLNMAAVEQLWWSPEIDCVNPAPAFADLKANTTYQQLMHQLEEIETAVLERREAYNAAARDYNSTRGSLPHLFYAEKLGFAEASYLAVDDAGLEQPRSFRTDDGKILHDTMGRMATVATAHAQAATVRLNAAKAASGGAEQPIGGDERNG